ncbi:MAG: hypothetical protein U0230_21185 [Polyangiales bacterium]
MTTLRGTYFIRPYRPEDRPRVREICYQTGYMGESAECFYGDRASFADMFSSYYTDHEPESCLVATRSTDGEVVGYLAGCVDSRKALDPTAIGLRHVLTRGLLFRPGTARFYLRLVADVMRDRGCRRTKVDLARYPAHFHIDLLPEARGGSGVRMVKRFHERLRQMGVPGAHAEMIAENRLAFAVAQRLGYEKVGEPYLLPGLRDREGRRLHGQLIAQALEPKKIQVAVPGSFLLPGELGGVA